MDKYYRVPDIKLPFGVVIVHGLMIKKFWARRK